MNKNKKLSAFICFIRHIIIYLLTDLFGNCFFVALYSNFMGYFFDGCRRNESR